MGTGQRAKSMKIKTDIKTIGSINNDVAFKDLRSKHTNCNLNSCFEQV
jgi:hypothetical protein